MPRVVNEIKRQYIASSKILVPDHLIYLSSYLSDLERDWDEVVVQDEKGEPVEEEVVVLEFPQVTRVVRVLPRLLD